MRIKAVTTIVVAALCAAAGLYTKTTTFSAVTADIRLEDAAKIRHSLERQGLRLIARVPITVNSDYAALRFRSRSCRGAIDIVPLYRNAEGQNLLSATAPAAKTAIAFDGRPYQRFPAFRYWVGEMRNLLHLSTRPALHSRAFALREMGDCDLIEPVSRLTRS